MKLHPSITLTRITECVERTMFDCENLGLCRACGEESGECEPDATNYVCESCGRPEVFGAQELLIMYAS